MLQKLTLLFPLWMILTGAMALSWPEWLLPLNQGSVVVLILGFIMLCMGLTLTFDDFLRIARMPKVVAPHPKGFGLPHARPSAGSSSGCAAPGSAAGTRRTACGTRSRSGSTSGPGTCSW